MLQLTLQKGVRSINRCYGVRAMLAFLHLTVLDVTISVLHFKYCIPYFYVNLFANYAKKTVFKCLLCIVKLHRAILRLSTYVAQKINHIALMRNN